MRGSGLEPNAKVCGLASFLLLSESDREKEGRGERGYQTPRANQHFSQFYGCF